MTVSASKTAKVIIGANFGDEGKGRMVDHFSDHQTLVVRHNSGSQAGHTVTMGDVRHVFHHFGSGSLKRAETYLSEFFVHNPINFGKELDDLAKIGVTPVVHADPNARVTTHYEMIINHIVEAARGSDRHGSCGVGFHETVVRDRDFCKIRLGADPSEFQQAIKKIRLEWLPKRLSDLGIDLDNMGDVGQYWKGIIDNADILEVWLEELRFMKDHFNLVEPERLVGRKIIFEGAQGLLLDQDNEKFFPHLTHSKTGITNAAILAPRFGIDCLDPVYVTRTYMTRHGNGPFPTEISGMEFEDKTNVPNDFQGTIRFGHLDVDLMVETINNDMQKANQMIGHPVIAVTCLDQTEEGLTIKYNNHFVEMGNHEFLHEMTDIFSTEVIGMPKDVDDKKHQKSVEIFSDSIDAEPMQV